MNKIKFQHGIEMLPWRMSPSRSKPHPSHNPKTTFSSSKHLPSCLRCVEFTKRETKLTATLKDKQSNLSRCLEYIQHLLKENSLLKKDIIASPAKQKTTEKRNKFKIDKVTHHKLLKDTSGPTAKKEDRSLRDKEEQIKRELKHLRAQRDKLADIVKDLQRQNQRLTLLKDESDLNYSRIIKSQKEELKQYTQPMKSSHVISSGIKSQPDEIYKYSEICQIKEPNCDMVLFETITRLKDDKQYAEDKVARLETMYRKSVSNYEDLMGRYSGELENSDRIRMEKERAFGRVKTLEEEQERLIKSRGGRNTTESETNEDEILKLKGIITHNLRQHNLRVSSFQKELEQSLKEKELLEEEVKVLRQSVSVLHSQHLVTQSTESQQLRESLNLMSKQYNQIIERKNEEIQYIREALLKIQNKEAAVVVPSVSVHVQCCCVTGEVGTQKNQQSFLAEQDLLNQLIEKDMTINGLELENAQLLQILKTMKGEVKGGDSERHVAKYKIENGRLREEIYAKDIKIHELERDQKGSEPTFLETKDSS